MLRLLDPAVYAETTPAELRARLEARAGLGRDLPGPPTGGCRFLSKGRLAEIKAEFPDDAELAEIVALNWPRRSARRTKAGSRRRFKRCAHMSPRCTGSIGDAAHPAYGQPRRRTASRAGHAGRTGPRTTADQDITLALDRWREQALATAEANPEIFELPVAPGEAVSLPLHFGGLRPGPTSAPPPASTRTNRPALKRMTQDLAFVVRQEVVSHRLRT